MAKNLLRWEHIAYEVLLEVVKGLEKYGVRSRGVVRLEWGGMVERVVELRWSSEDLEVSMDEFSERVVRPGVERMCREVGLRRCGVHALLPLVVEVAEGEVERGSAGMRVTDEDSGVSVVLGWRPEWARVRFASRVVGGVRL